MTRHQWLSWQPSADANLIQIGMSFPRVSADLVLMDIFLPRMSGIEYTLWLKELLPKSYFAASKIRASFPELLGLS